MDAYTTYEFYSKHFSKRESAIKKADFPFYALKAKKIMDNYTFNRINELLIPVQMCCCEIANNLYNADLQEEKCKGIISQKTDDVSESYESSKSRQEELNRKNRQSINTWLSDTRLLYRGFD